MGATIKVIMTPMLTLKKRTPGFALPTILIAAVVMLIVLVASITLASSVGTALSSQYYNQLAREAAESGLANANFCLKAYNFTPTWTDDNPLVPDTDCTGVSPNGASKWIVNSNNIRTTFSVSKPVAAGASSLRFVSTGTVQLTRTSDQNAVWRTFTATIAKTSRYNDAPQIASGAGWKDNGHDGYMLASTGVLYGWGDNSGSQIGDSSLGTTITLPTKIALPSGVTKVKKVFNSGQGASILCILGDDNQAYCRGKPGAGETGLMPTTPGWQRFALPGSLMATDMVVNGYGADSACVLASDLQAYCAGENTTGSLGNGTTSAAVVPISAPTKFRLDLASPGPVSGSATSLTVKQVFNHDRFVCVIASDNQAYCTGDNNYGQLGQGTFTKNVSIGKSIPGRAVVPGAPAIADVRLSYHGYLEGIMFQTSDNRVFFSGHNGAGTAGDGSFTGSCPQGGGAAVNCYPTPGLMGSPVGRLISVGERGDNRHGICGIMAGSISDSGLYCLGSNSYGEAGMGNCTDNASWVGPAGLNGERATYSATTEADYQMNSVMVITTAGNVYSAGDNTYGKLGTGAPLQACNSTYGKVQLPTGVKAVALANGDEYTSFILGDNGSVYAMGRNNNGQLGDGTTTDRSKPVQVQIPRQETVY